MLMRKNGWWVAGGLMVASAGLAHDGVAYHSAASLKDAEAKLLEQARTSANGIASLAMEKYPGHFMNLVARTKSGGGEIHARWSDVFVVLDGEATVIVGGTVVDPKDGVGGEVRGAKLEGGTSYLLKKGDVLHILAGTPHQTVVAPGHTFTYFVVKAEAPKP